MTPHTTDIALLESALATIEKVLARADSAMQGVPYQGPTTNVPLEVLQASGLSDEQRFRLSAAQSAVNICLSSAATLVDVSQSLMNPRPERSPQEMEREWKTLVSHTKIASRSAYRAALLIAAQKHGAAAVEGGAGSGEAPRPGAH